MRPRPTIRLRLTALYAVVVFLAGGLLLAVSYALLDGHLHNTLSDATADDLLAQLRGQYLVALFAVTALAVLLGWVIAGRALAPLRAIATAARAVSGDSLTRRVALRGPDDELRELADTFDDMLERLDSAFASQKRFVADASHELRTPLTVLRTEVEVALADPGASAAELRTTAEVVREEVQRFEALLESLLALARSEARALAREEPVDIAELTRRVVSRLQSEAALRDVVLTVEPERAVVNGDRGLLEQLIFNLVDNAVAHNCSGGLAEVRVGPRGDSAALTVTNTGPRVPDESVRLLTEPFHRLERRRDRRGAGVGLSIVRAVAAAHGGRLDLSARKDGGLVADVELPAVRAPRGAPRGPRLLGRGSSRESRSAGGTRPEQSAQPTAR
jgi:signal transduction histidine kinase